MSCTLCRLHSTCKSVKVDSRGADNPRVLFVGQAPGEQEDDRNKIFVGPAGELLLQAIKEYNLKPARLTNLVRCFPPNDRDPKADEIKACKPFLLQDIEKYKPEIIVTLGNLPLRALTGKNGVTTYSGNIVGQYNGSKVFSLFHPSYIMRYPANKSKFEMHLQSLGNLFHGKKKSSEQIEVRHNLDIKEAGKYITGEKEFVSFDFETTGEYKPYGGEITLVSFNVTGFTFTVGAMQAGFKDFFKWFLKTEVKKCAFNSIFETRWCLDEFGMEPRNLVYDPYLMHYLLDENSSHDLESVAHKYLGVENWDIMPQMLENEWTWKTVPFEKLSHYSGLDSKYTAGLVYPMIQELKEKDLWEVYKTILLPLSKLCARMGYRGMKLDKEYAKVWEQKFIEECAGIKNRMTKLLKLKKEFNPNSSQQIAGVLKILRISTGIKTDGGKMSVGADALKPLKEKHKFIELYLDWKEKNTLRNNFLSKYQTMIDKKDLIHPNFNPAYIVTGRLSCSEPSAQNVPRDENVRGMIVSRFKEGQLLSNDFEQLEMRLVASESSEMRLIELFKKNGDPHNMTAELVFGKDFTEKQRYIAKTMNFGIVYGINSWSLAKELLVSEELAENYIRKFNKAYPNITKWMREQHDFVRKNGWLKSRFGRVRRLPDATLSDERTVARALRQAGNFPIQSQGSDITNLSGMMVDKELRRGSMKSKLVHIIHDALLVDVYPGDEDLVKLICKDVMEQKVRKHTPWLKVELKISQELSKRWGGKND